MFDLKIGFLVKNCIFWLLELSRIPKFGPSMNPRKTRRKKSAIVRFVCFLICPYDSLCVCYVFPLYVPYVSSHFFNGFLIFWHCWLQLFMLHRISLCYISLLIFLFLCCFFPSFPPSLLLYLFISVFLSSVLRCRLAGCFRLYRGIIEGCFGGVLEDV